jgi:hypothetical protein
MSFAPQLLKCAKICSVQQSKFCCVCLEEKGDGKEIKVCEKSDKHRVCKTCLQNLKKHLPWKCPICRTIDEDSDYIDPFLLHQRTGDPLSESYHDIDLVPLPSDSSDDED